MSCWFALPISARHLYKAVLSILVLGFCLSTGVGPVKANPKYASIVIDANTGKVLHQSHSDAYRYPASLTKIMTLYILFDYLKKGRLKYDTKFYVTPHAASQPPSKLGLKAGQYIRVKDVIGALVTKSANDAAAVAAENIAGSEAKFARLMTKRARDLGMSRTTFKNASGLPDRDQRTTARDMARLSLRVMNDFPHYSKFFKTRRFRFKRRAFRNHNRLLFSYKGTEGIKTGYTRASGFNLTTSVRRGQKHLIAVVMGGKTAGRRNAHMKSLLNKNFPRAIAMSTKLPLANRLAQLSGRRPAKVVYTSATKDATNWKNRHRPKKISQPSATFQKPFTPEQFKSRPSQSGYDIQVGAYEDRNMAIGKLNSIREQAGTLLQGYTPYIMKYTKGKTNYHRARFAGFSSRSGANNICDRLKQQAGTNCIVMLP